LLEQIFENEKIEIVMHSPRMPTLANPSPTR
jgi:hypothetical protein